MRTRATTLKNPACCVLEADVNITTHLICSKEHGAIPAVKDQASRLLVGIGASRDLTCHILATGAIPMEKTAQQTGTPQTAEYKLPIGDVERTYEVRFVPNAGDTVVSMMRDITERKEAEEALQASYAQIRDLSGRLITAEETERSRIARELHDNINQRIATLSLTLSLVKQHLPKQAGGLCEELTRLQQLTNALANEIRHLSHELHQGALPYLGLASALQSHCAEFASLHAISVTFHHDSPADIPPEQALCLYRIAQEALRNIATHAHARQVDVTLTGTDEDLELRIQDDGRGFDMSQTPPEAGLGLFSMEERVRLLRGRLSVESEPGKGTRLQAQLPLSIPS